MTDRKVNRVLYAQQVNMDGLMVRQPFPTQQVDQIDPFLLLHHGRLKIEPGRNALHLGVGPHPHRGFSPVTFIFEGGVHHRDSRGNNSVVYAGGTQWMHAGMGIIHSERPPSEMAEKGGLLEIIQLWINVPGINKMEQPSYQALSKETTPVIQEDLLTIQVVAGQLHEISGPIRTITPMNVYRLEFQKGSEYTFPVPEGHNALIYFLNGKARISGYGLIEGKNLALFENEGDQVSISAIDDFKGIFLTGKPLNEPVEIYGPYVMNTQTQIMQAVRDYQMGKMGFLVEE